MASSDNDAQGVEEDRGTWAGALKLTMSVETPLYLHRPGKFTCSARCGYLAR